MVPLGMDFCTNFVPPTGQSGLFSRFGRTQNQQLACYQYPPWSSIPSLGTRTMPLLKQGGAYLKVGGSNPPEPLLSRSKYRIVHKLTRLALRVRFASFRFGFNGASTIVYYRDI